MKPATFRNGLARLALPLALLSCSLSLRVAFDYHKFQDFALMGDLYPRWYGAHEALLHGRNPYSPEVAGEIQQAFYGHPLAAGDDHDQQRFAYPAYVVFFLWPTLWLPFNAVRLVVSGVLLIAIVAMVLSWLKVLGWYSWRNGVVAALLTVNTVPAIQGLKLQQLAILTIMLMSFGILAIARGKLVSGGVLFALATIKPQIALLPVLWLFAWSFYRWSERKRFVFGFAFSLATLVLLGELVVPGWVSLFVKGLFAYSNYAVLSSPLLVVLLGKTAGTLACSVVLIGGAVIASRYLTAAGNTPAFLFATALIFCAASLCVPSLAAPYNELLLLPALLLLLPRFSSLPFWLGIALMTIIFLPSISALASGVTFFDRLLIVPITVGMVLPVIVLAALLRDERAIAHEV